MEPFRVALAPEQLWQAINPWNFYNQGAQLGLINISLGRTAHPEVERRLLDEVGSYGRQIGHLGDALEVLIRHFDRAGLSEKEQRALDILLGELGQVRNVKARALAEAEEAAGA